MPSSLSERFVPLCPWHCFRSTSPSPAADGWSFWHFKVTYSAPSSKHRSCRYSQPPTALGALCFKGAKGSGFPALDSITQVLDNPTGPITQISYLFLKGTYSGVAWIQGTPVISKPEHSIVFFDTFGSTLFKNRLQTANIPVCKQVNGRRICVLQLPLPVLYRVQPATEEQLCKLLPSQIFGWVRKTHCTQAAQNHHPIICTEPEPESLRFI